MIKGIALKNFQSWGDLLYELESGVTLFDGWNLDDNTAEGSGKSAILNSIVWAFFGKLPKESKIDEVIKSGEKSASVEVIIEHPTYNAIFRSRNPNELHLVDSNGEKVRGKDAKETQKMIEDILGLSFDTFCQTIYFPQNYQKKFITSNQEERGKILSEIQDLEIFEKARKKAKDLDEVETKYQMSMRQNIELNKTKLDNTNHILNSELEFTQRRELEKVERVKNLKQKETSLTFELMGLENSLTEYAENIDQMEPEEAEWQTATLEIDTAIEDLLKQVAELNFELQNQNKIQVTKRDMERDVTRFKSQISQLELQKNKLEAFLKNPTKTCPSCGTEKLELDTSHVEIELNEIKDNIKNKMLAVNQFSEDLTQMNSISTEETKTKLRENQSAISELREVKKDFINKQNLLVKTKNEAKNMQTYVNAKQTELQEAEKNRKNEENRVIETDAGKIAKLGLEKAQLTEKISIETDLKQKSENRSTELVALREGFKEVKSYTFNSVLNELTIKTNKYLEFLFEVPIKIKFTNDSMKIEVEIDMNGYSRSYGLLSGGQQRRVGLAVDLALSDIISNRSGSMLANFRFLDEYFKDLDENSMQKCLQLLEKLGGTTILIEHNSLFKSIVNNTVQIELQNQTSRIVS